MFTHALLACYYVVATVYVIQCIIFQIKPVRILCGHKVQVTLFAWGYAELLLLNCYVKSKLLSFVTVEWVNDSNS